MVKIPITMQSEHAQQIQAIKSAASSAARPSVSAVEMFHPDGCIRKYKIIGSGCPQPLIPREAVEVDGDADLVLVAPNQVEGRRAGWFHIGLSQAAGACANDGFVYILAPPKSRTEIVHLLRQNGFSFHQWVAHFPGWERSRYLLPLQPGPVRYALENLMPTAGWKQMVTRLLVQFQPGIGFLLRSLPFVAVAAFREQPPEFFRWLGSGFVQPSFNAVMQVSEKTTGGSIVLAVFESRKSGPAGKNSTAGKNSPAGKDSPAQVVKVHWPQPETGSHPEYEALSRFAVQVRASGASLPAVIKQERVENRGILVTEPLPGPAAAVLLRSNRRRVDWILKKIFSWLLPWNRLTSTYAVLQSSDLAEFLLRPLEILGRSLPDPDGYLSWLYELAGSIREQIPFSAAHCDLTMWNILLDREGRLGIVDWEAAIPHALPLTDYFYSLLDGISLSRNISRLQAFKASVAQGSHHWNLNKSYLLEFTRLLAIPSGAIDLSLHACFLHHAANERLKNKSEDLQFFELACWLAQARYSVEKQLFQ